ncbi:MAG: ComF family protein [candidate division Zixibacteria bacterium]|nr:ComF family protein [candidate division Zixibacteria bacterium]MDH3938253.1 ComF family protein [candidate division Zixibacteria bacterium]
MVSLRETANSCLGVLWDFVYPPLCLGCGGFYDGEHSVCERCFETIHRFEDPICLNCLSVLAGGPRCPICTDLSLPLFALGDYAPPLKDIILQFKFKGITTPARLMAGLLWQQFGDRLTMLNPTVLVSIPLHPGRESQRGYNQAALLTDQLGLLMDVPVNNNLLTRIEKRKPQASLRLRQRMKNIKGVFEATPAEGPMRGLLLVDDVVTSGATVLEATRTLTEAGYEVVAIAAIAHGR